MGIGIVFETDSNIFWEVLEILDFYVLIIGWGFDVVGGSGRC